MYKFRNISPLGDLVVPALRCTVEAGVEFDVADEAIATGLLEQNTHFECLDTAWVESVAAANATAAADADAKAAADAEQLAAQKEAEDAEWLAAHAVAQDFPAAAPVEAPSTTPVTPPETPGVAPPEAGQPTGTDQPSPGDPTNDTSADASASRWNTTAAKAPSTEKE